MRLLTTTLLFPDNPIFRDYRHCDVRNLMWKPRAITSKTAAKIEMMEAA